MSTTPPGERLTLLPDPRLTSVAPLLEERLEMTGRHVTAENFSSLLDPLMRRMLADAFEDARAHEGLIWLLDSDASQLAVAWQTGPATSQWSGTRVPAGTGLHGLVLASQQPHCANRLYTNPDHDHTLDQRLGGILCAEVIVPFYIAHQLKGLVTALQTKPDADAPDPPGFDPESLEEIELLSTSLGRLLDYRLQCLALGIEE
jgi:GAF domain-containing protein